MPGFINRLLERRRMEREGQLGTRKRRTESMLIAAVDRSSVMTLALVILLWALCVMLLTLPGKRNYPQLVINQTAPHTVFSRTDFACQNRAETEAKKQEVANNQPWFFLKSSENTSRIEENADLLFDALNQRFQCEKNHTVFADNSNKMAEKSGVQQIGSFVLAVVLGVITCGIYTLVWMYKFFKQQVEIAKANGVTVQPVEEPIILLILCCVPVYSYYMLCDIYNKNVDATAPRFA